MAELWRCDQYTPLPILGGSTCHRSLYKTPSREDSLLPRLPSLRADRLSDRAEQLEAISTQVGKPDISVGFD